jgi:biotin synthesis protein BioG
MKTEWLHRNDNEWLIVFFNGWGMDSHPFRPLSSEKYDVLCCYDYSDHQKSVDIKDLAQGYDRLDCIGWSMGVANGQKKILDIAEYFHKIVAINGTLQPIDDMHGIPVEICRGTLEALNEETLLKFNRRMCGSSNVYTKFMENKPQRNIDDIHNELSTLMENMETAEIKSSIFTDIIISRKDMIIPTKNQEQFWSNAEAGKIHRLESSHFPFYLWKSWDELLGYID